MNSTKLTSIWENKSIESIPLIKMKIINITYLIAESQQNTTELFFWNDCYFMHEVKQKRKENFSRRFSMMQNHKSIGKHWKRCHHSIDVLLFLMLFMKSYNLFVLLIRLKAIVYLCDVYVSHALYLLFLYLLWLLFLYSHSAWICLLKTV